MKLYHKFENQRRTERYWVRRLDNLVALYLLGLTAVAFLAALWEGVSRLWR